MPPNQEIRYVYQILWVPERLRSNAACNEGQGNLVDHPTNHRNVHLWHEVGTIRPNQNSSVTNQHSSVDESFAAKNHSSHVICGVSYRLYIHTLPHFFTLQMAGVHTMKERTATKAAERIGNWSAALTMSLASRILLGPWWKRTLMT